MRFLRGLFISQYIDCTNCTTIAMNLNGLSLDALTADLNERHPGDDSLSEQAEGSEVKVRGLSNLFVFLFSCPKHIC